MFVSHQAYIFSRVFNRVLSVKHLSYMRGTIIIIHACLASKFICVQLLLHVITSTSATSKLPKEHYWNEHESDACVCQVWTELHETDYELT